MNRNMTIVPAAFAAKLIQYNSEVLCCAVRGNGTG